ncbi:Cof-type HAD-IIB family hydrolase [Pseudogracilibacillus sp. SO30301A]|uniref:Cof-type HAD-IIB family hydrolase n=1 Tax=Pseudogracilibacillus sp. SO30301A TaxID=3098291 RepID=UPI00300E0680
MPNYRLLALDLDGTVLNEKKQISKRNKDWILRTKKAGVIVMFTTGRGMHRVKYFLDELDLTGPVVLVNGAEIWRSNDQLLERHFISKEDIHRLHKIALAYQATFWGYSNDSFIKGEDWNETMFQQNWMKFGMKHTEVKTIDQIRRQLLGMEEIEVSSSGQLNLEISLKGITKEYGVKKICREFGIGFHEVMAIGDNMNDYRLLKNCGLGIATGNASPEIKAIADTITDTNERDGVAKAIENFLF